jgi:flagellar motor protein MotB
MARALRAGTPVNVWPAFTDAMLAFVLVLVLMLAYQVGRSIQIVGPDAHQIIEDQTRVEGLLNSLALESVHYTRRLGRHEITFGSEALFPSGSADLNAQGRALLGELARRIAGEGLPTLQEIQVAGHTDTEPTTSARYPTNWELSTARATEVVRFLTAGGVDPRSVRLSATGYGEFAPISTDLDENRRIEMRLLYTQEGSASEREDAP